MNRFEAVDEPDDNAVTLSLWVEGETVMDSATGPVLPAGKGMEIPIVQPQPTLEALAGAVAMANRHQLLVVVCDPAQL